MGSGLFLALIKINGQPSVIWVQNFITSMFEPQERLWKKTPVVPDILRETPASHKVEVKQDEKLLSKARVVAIPEQPLEKLSEEEQMLDTAEAKDLGKIDEHFDFLFNQVPKLTSEEPVINSTVPVTPPEQKMVYKKPETLAESVKPQFSQEKIYEGSNYAVAYRPFKNQDQRPLGVTTSNIEKTETAQAPDQLSISNPQSPYYLVGSVQNKFKEPLAQAQVNVVDLSGKVVRSMQTDANGRFGLNSRLPEGDYYLDISKSNFNFDRVSVNIVSDKIQDLVISAKN
jgi:hypothetical protein